MNGHVTLEMLKSLNPSLLCFSETAINIGYSCRLLQEDMDLHTISEEESDDILNRLDEIVKVGEEMKAMGKDQMDFVVSFHSFSCISKSVLKVLLMEYST